MKKNIYKIGFIITVLMLLTNITPVFAQPSSTPTSQTPSTSTSQPPPPASNTKANVTKSSDLFAPVTSNNSSIQAVRKLIPKSKSYVTIITSIIKILLNIAGALALLGFTIGGVLMIVGTQGQESLLKKGKDLVKATVFGLIVIAVSYALVLGVSELQFFSPGAGGTSSSPTTTSHAIRKSSTPPGTTGVQGTSLQPSS